MRNIIKFTVLGFVILFNSCTKKDKPSENELLYDEVMVIHDEVMPKMTDIRKEISKANKVIKEKSWSSKEDSSKIYLLKKNLERADQVMWDWMHGFDQEGAKGKHAKTYLLEEKVKISIVRDQMLKSIQNSKNYHQSL